MATERELEKSESTHLSNILFDSSGHFILYPTMIGIKLVNIETNRCIKIIGKGDNVRPLHIGLFQGRTKKAKAALSIEQEGSDNPILAQTYSDPTLFITAFKWVTEYIYSQFHFYPLPMNLFTFNSSSFVNKKDTFINILWFDYRKNRFYLYSKRMPSDLQNVERDVFNEKPSKEDIIAVPEGQGKLKRNIAAVQWNNLFGIDWFSLIILFRLK